MKEARERGQITQAEAALAAGVSQPTISNWESGRHLPSLIQFRALLALYGETGYRILFGENLFELTAQESRELTTRSKEFSDGLQRKMEWLLMLLATSGADNAKSGPRPPDFASSSPEG